MRRQVANLYEGLKRPSGLHIAFTRDPRCGPEINDIQLLIMPEYTTLGRPKPNPRTRSTLRRNNGVSEVPPLGYHVIKTLHDDDNCAANISGYEERDFFLSFSQQF
eukprot:TRINITY_DN5006_c0_g1_i3.p1 TRINITY_DN5006_c0_g1~~TRINITY_DN5006_c0_g1_i3.p1  ORF type:complete len:106 (+),score=6.72 TRINITY_DN5006_c0_g1_i3:101-418(+)